MATGGRSGQYFIAYRGDDVSAEKIEMELRNRCRSSEQTVKVVKLHGGCFAKMVLSSYTDDRDPYFDSSSRVTSVNGYNQAEMARLNGTFDLGITDEDQISRTTNFMYKRFGNRMFKKMNSLHVCAAIYDDKTEELIAGVTEPNNQYTHMYYGYTSPNNEIMFSNNEEILKEFCHDVNEMPSNSYMVDKQLYDLDGNKIENTVSNDDDPLIKNNRENAESLIGGLNKLLVQVTNEAVREKIEKNVEDYLASDDPKKRITDYIVKELDGQTQREVLKLIKEAIEKNNLEETIDRELTGKFDEKLNEYVNNISLPVVHIIKLKDTVLGKTKGAFYHEKFEEILSQVQLNEPILLIGPAGSGKNVAVQQVADALGLHMYYTNNASNEFKLTGFIDAGGNYRETEFYRAFKNGGLFNLDEIDASDPTALIVINSALANGYMAFPHETIDRHPDFRIVAAANTWGKGSDLQYVGRNALDGATLDRFDNVFMDYDRKLEKNLYPNDEVLEFMWGFRDAVEKSKIHHIVSTRGIGKVYKKHVNNFPVELILRTNIVRNLGQDDVNTIIGNMRNVPNSNRYMDGIKKLTLTR